ncbi:MAG: ABC transporter ATP-binding protein [Anaerolineae bacterium]|nr:ABC transporter ATP-binding protein [Anaerolineae bacterium]MCA9910716.1 ABC transporter ATP-binding protein [Anaerolineae bacterium]
MLEVRDLNVAYGDAQALWNVSLTVNDGEIVTIVGPNGAGKTTLVNALSGIVPSRSGQILFNGLDLVRIAAHRFCSHGIAVVPEGRHVFVEMNVRHNLDLGAYLPQARPYHSQTLEQVYTLFPILKQRERQIAGTLSGGQQQMLAIGRALMTRPRLLLLDEPSLGLSPLLVDHIFEVIHDINRSGVSILLVEQNVVKALQSAGRGYIIEGGQIVQGGVAHELLNNERIKQVYLGLADTVET